jgi:hypothetical protein
MQDADDVQGVGGVPVEDQVRAEAANGEGSQAFEPGIVAGIGPADRRGSGKAGESALVGGTECVPILVREGALVIEALSRARALFPFPLKGVDFDNDSAFMNDLVVPWCREQGLEVTRARAYRKNDQAWVEQKNGAIVRRLVGYGRLEGLLAVEALARLYAASRLHGAIVQAAAEDASGRASDQALSRAGTAGGAGTGASGARRGDQGPAAGAAAAVRSGAAAGGDPGGAGGARRAG